MSTFALTALRAGNQTLGRVVPGVVARRAAVRFMTPRRLSPRPWELEAEARGRRDQLLTGLRYVRWDGDGPGGGAGDGESPVLMLHGWEARATQFGPLALEIAGRGAPVVALDGPAHGHSPGARAHMAAFARALLEADRELGPFRAVVGHSMGGGAAAIALSWGLRAERAVLVAAPASVREVIEGAAVFMGLPDPAVGRFTDWLVEHVGIEVDGVGAESLGPRMTVPALVVHSRDDVEVAFDDALRIAKAWPGAGLLELDGLGHRRLLRDPSVLERIADFAVRAS